MPHASTREGSSTILTPNTTTRQGGGDVTVTHRKRDVSSVDDVSAVFVCVTSFNGDRSKWNVSGVHDMNDMFLCVHVEHMENDT